MFSTAQIDEQIVGVNNNTQLGILHKSARNAIISKNSSMAMANASASTNTQLTKDLNDMLILKVGVIDVHVPRHLNCVPCNDWVNYQSYMVDGWYEEEMYCEGYNEISNEDWLKYYTYIEEDTGRYIFNGKKTWPSHLMEKYKEKDYVDYNNPPSR